MISGTPVGAAEVLAAGVIDKIATELLGFDTSRCRPPTRDIREEFRPQMRAFMERIGVPNMQVEAQPA